MIAFAPKPNAVPKTQAIEESHFDRIRRLAADKRRKADAGLMRRGPQKAGDKRPI